MECLPEQASAILPGNTSPLPDALVHSDVRYQLYPLVTTSLHARSTFSNLTDGIAAGWMIGTQSTPRRSHNFAETFPVKSNPYTLHAPIRIICPAYAPLTAHRMAKTPIKSASIFCGPPSSFLFSRSELINVPRMVFSVKTRKTYVYVRVCAKITHKRNDAF